VPVDSSSWTTVSGLRAQSLKAWNSGALLRKLLEPSGAYPRRRALKRPTAAALLSEYAAAQRWAAELFAGAGRYSLDTVEVGRRTVGSNRIPAVAVFATVEDEIGFVGKSREAARFRELTGALGALDPLLLGWAARRPVKLLELGSDALTAARVALWLRDNAAPGIYVRQLGLPACTLSSSSGTGRSLIRGWRRSGTAPMAERWTPRRKLPRKSQPWMCPREMQLWKTVPAALPPRFARRHGFLHPPELVRFRILDPKIPALGCARDITVTAEAFSTLSCLYTP
jgi:hypothetical protein